MENNSTPQSDTPQNINSKDVLAYFKKLAKEILDLDHGVDKWGTINEVKAKQSMSGANAWMLMCSIMIASIGLNLDSQAVIIGAMLISPLMSPILGVGVAVGINDKDALYNALMHFAAAIVIALVTSVIYFFLTPLDEFTGQIQARTEPTFLDVLIAVFGGIAGIVSIARKDISTTLPGVAIATALMPPLCVTGYGIANGSLEIATKAFYLFFLNSFFVAFVTYLMTRYLGFPYRKYATKKERRNNILIVSVVSLILTIPSVLIFLNVYKEYQDEKTVALFLDQHIGDNQIYLDDHQLLRFEDGSRKLILKVYGDSIRKDKAAFYEQKLESLDMENVDVEIIPTSEINLDKVRQLELELSEVGDKINNQIIELNKEKEEHRIAATQARPEDKLMKFDSSFVGAIFDEVRIFLPEIKSLDIGVVNSVSDGQVSVKMPLIVAEWDKPRQNEVDKLKRFIESKYDLDSIKLIVN